MSNNFFLQLITPTSNDLLEFTRPLLPLKITELKPLCFEAEPQITVSDIGEKRRVTTPNSCDSYTRLRIVFQTGHISNDRSFTSSSLSLNIQGIGKRRSVFRQQGPLARFQGRSIPDYAMGYKKAFANKFILVDRWHWTRGEMASSTARVTRRWEMN